MANIKIAQLTNQTAISDNDLIIVETATSTNKMTVGTFKDLIGVNDTRVVSYGSAGGSRVIPLDTNSVYLLLVGRDQGMYLVSTFGSDGFVTPIMNMGGAGSITVSGLSLTIDFSTRTRPWSLIKFNK